MRDVSRRLRDKWNSLRSESQTKSRRSDWRAPQVENRPIGATDALCSVYVARGERHVVLTIVRVRSRTFSQFRGVFRGREFHERIRCSGVNVC